MIDERRDEGALKWRALVTLLVNDESKHQLFNFICHPRTLTYRTASWSWNGLEVCGLLQMW